MRNGKFTDNHGNVWYYKDDLFHRIDGPAIEFVNGSKAWYINGKCHRLDGPAKIWSNNNVEYCIDNKMYTEEGFKEEIKRRGLASPNYFKNML